MRYLQVDNDAVPRHGSTRSDEWGVLLSKAIDAAIIVGVLTVTAAIYVETWNARYGLAALVGALVFLLLAEIPGLYRPWRGETATRQVLNVLLVWVASVFVLLLLAYALKETASYSRLSIGVWLVSTPILLCAWRGVALVFLKRLVAHGQNRRKVVVWGNSEAGDQLARTIEGSPWLGFDLVAHIKKERPEPAEQADGRAPGDERSDLDLLEFGAKRGDFDILYIVLPATERGRIVEMINRLSDTTVSIYMVPDYFTTSLFSGKLTNLAGIPVISVFDTPFWGVDGMIKRGQDILLSSIFLVFAAAPMLVIAAAVKLSSPGPVFFRQARYGMDGRKINVWKFRTMKVCEDGESVPQATKQDPRVTRVGAFLRRTSLDELPQFINVLRGEMSIVGPRPHAVAHNEMYRTKVRGYMLRHKVRPGITGWAQINGWRGETDTLDKMAKRVEYDLWYIHHWSLMLDLKIIFITALREFRGANAY